MCRSLIVGLIRRITSLIKFYPSGTLICSLLVMGLIEQTSPNKFGLLFIGDRNIIIIYLYFFIYKTSRSFNFYISRSFITMKLLEILIFIFRTYASANFHVGFFIC